MSTFLFHMAGWAYLPDFVTRQVLFAIHRVSATVFKTSPPPPRTPGYVQHYRYTYTAVVLCYLIYNFIGASSGLPVNFYELLGVDPRTDDGSLKAAFRAFAKKNHPDRAGPGGEALFIEVRDAFEALKDPVVRFAYDRFGPDVVRWQGCTTAKDYLRQGLLNSVPRHVMTGVALFLFSAVGKRSPIEAWRYLLFVAMFALELYLIVTPTLSSSPSSGSIEYTFVDQVPPSSTMLLENVFPQRVAYQHIMFLHTVFWFMSFALSKIAPVLFAGVMKVDGEVEQGVVRAMGERIGELTKGVERELSIMVNTELYSVNGGSSLSPAQMLVPPLEMDEYRMGLLMREMEDIVVESKLKNEVGPMRSAWERAAERRSCVSRARAMSV